MKLEEIDYYCYHKILSALTNNLYTYILSTRVTKKLWNALEEKYGLDDAGIELFISSSLNKFMMVDSKPINEQIHEFQDYIRHLQTKKNQFSNDYKVSCLIDKLFHSGQILLETFVTSRGT